MANHQKIFDPTAKAIKPEKPNAAVITIKKEILRTDGKPPEDF